MEKQQWSSCSFEGTTRWKELHGTKTVKAFSGTWAQKPVDVTFQAYRLSSACDQPGESFSPFVLLTEAKLDDEVASMEVDLFLTPNKIVKSSVSACGQVHLDADQVRKSKLFHEFLFNGIFGKLLVGPKSSCMERNFLLNRDDNYLWSESNMYLLLPMEASAASNLEPLNICWNAIDSCACVVEYLRKVYSSSDEYCCGSSLDGNVHSLETGRAKSDIIYLANKNVDRDCLKDMVVYTIHTGNFYSVLDVEVGTSAEDPFDQDNDQKSSYSSYSDYFCKKYGIVLQHPRQPLLLLEHSHSAHNLLIPRFKYEGASCRLDVMAEKKISPDHMPPELLIQVDVSTEVMKSLYLLPSLMHRLESLLLACQLREEIACHPSDCHISNFLILEAITTLRCCESFSLERLELLGDSVLKYAVSCHLFLKYPREHEGQLSACRTKSVCNMMLHKVGTSHNLQRLEFLGDSLLDLLITWHLFRSYEDIGPGELTDLRSANVNNEKFAEAAVRHCLHQHLQHSSGVLLEQVAEYVKCIQELYDKRDLLLPPGKSKRPKALGDLMESIAGAVLIDTEFDLDRVWGIFGPLLSHIVTPDTLELPPLRELMELCGCLGYFSSTSCTNVNDQVVAEITVQLKDQRLVRHGCGRNRKSAKAQAAHHLLKDLEERGISLAHCVPRKRQNQDKVDEFYHSATSFGVLGVPRGTKPSGSLSKREDIVAFLPTSESSQDISLVGELEHGKVDEYSKDNYAVKLKEPAVLQIKMHKGGPRNTLFMLCKMQEWPMPEFSTTEERSRAPIEIKGLFETRTGFSVFTSSIALHIPNHAAIKLVGGQEADKNCSKDSAAYGALLELERLGWCILIITTTTTMDP